jgi:hypothetical protein
MPTYYQVNIMVFMINTVKKLDTFVKIFLQNFKGNFYY